MPVDPATSLRIIKFEIADCQIDAKNYGWEFSEINETALTFTVKMKSPIDSQPYILEVQFDNYKEIPLFLEFIDPVTGEKGNRKAYPKTNDSFFHDHPGICNPASRKAYGRIHNDWGDPVGWQTNAKVGTFKDLKTILNAIYGRIADTTFYVGRMA